MAWPPLPHVVAAHGGARMIDPEDGMSNGNENTSSVSIVAIIAILLLVGVAAWFMFGRSGRKVSPTPTQTSAPAQPNSDVNVKVDLPDSINIHP